MLSVDKAWRRRGIGMLSHSHQCELYTISRGGAGVGSSADGFPATKLAKLAIAEMASRGAHEVIYHCSGSSWLIVKR